MNRRFLRFHNPIEFVNKITITPITPIRAFNKKTISGQSSNELNTTVLFNFVLSKFPEINADLVKLKYVNIKTSMASRPILYSFLKKEMKYEIIINKKKNIEIAFETIPTQAKIGLIAHELAHILDYQHKTKFQIIKTGFLYIFGLQADYEKSIDFLTIKKGFGWQLWAWSDFALNHSSASKAYKDFKRKNYLTPDEIKEIISKNKIYEKSSGQTHTF